MIKPSIYYASGLNCGESMIKAYNEEHNTNIPIAIGSGMGTGNAVASVCGSVSAAVVLIGYLKGRKNELEANEARKYTRELMTRIRNNYNTEICSELKKNKVSCTQIMDFTYEELNKILLE